MMGYSTGPFFYFDVMRTIEEQVTWLNEIRPQLLTTYPSNLKYFLDHCATHDIDLSQLDAVTTMSEVLDPETRVDCQTVLGVGASLAWQ